MSLQKILSTVCVKLKVALNYYISFKYPWNVYKKKLCLIIFDMFKLL